MQENRAGRLQWLAERDAGCTAVRREAPGGDPARGTHSYVSPVARALMGKQVGDVVPLGKSDAEILQIRTL